MYRRFGGGSSSTVINSGKGCSGTSMKMGPSGGSSMVGSCSRGVVSSIGCSGGLLGVSRFSIVSSSLKSSRISSCVLRSDVGLFCSSSSVSGMVLASHPSFVLWRFIFLLF